MTQYNQATLKTFFQTNDVPSGNDYANFIDSYVNVVDTGVQTVAGTLNPAELVTPRVSATNGVFTGNLAVSGTFTQANLSTNIVSAVAIFSNFVATSSFATNAVTVTGDVSATTGTVYASAVRSSSGFIGSVGIVSAAGVTQATAASLTNVINRGKGIADGATTGFTPLANRPGLVQYLFNEGVSANLWPPVGGTINGLAANAAFSLAASAMVTIVHLTASAMAAK